MDSGQPGAQRLKDAVGRRAGKAGHGSMALLVFEEPIVELSATTTTPSAVVWAPPASPAPYTAAGGSPDTAFNSDEG